MLQGSFYTYSTTNTEGQFCVTFNAQHPIFKAHFPGKPVVPGVCLMQICKELAELHCGKKMNIKTARNIKFLQMLSPNTHPTVQFSLNAERSENDAQIAIRAVVSLGELTFSKLQITLHPQIK